MANYINKTILSESYAHIESVHLSQNDKKEFEMDIKAYQAPRAKRMLGLDIEPVVRTEDGSLKVYLTVYGSLAEALGEFNDFREALQGLYHSSKMVADACNLESLFLAGGTKKDLIRSEARTGVVKSTKDLFDRAMYLVETAEKFSHKRLSTYVDDLVARVAKLQKNLTEEKDRILVWQNMAPVFKKLPPRVNRLLLSQDDEFTKVLQGTLTTLYREITLYK